MAEEARLADAPRSTTAYQSAEPCWRCGRPLLYLTPPLRGDWHFYCPACEHLTSPRAELERAMRELEDGAVGVVAAVPARLRFSLEADLPDREGTG